MTFPAALFPDTARLTARNTLGIGGCDLVALAAEYSTPDLLAAEDLLIAGGEPPAAPPKT